MIISATYFDGKSTTSRLVTLQYKEQNKSILIEGLDLDSFEWELKNICFERLGSLLEIRNKNQESALIKIDDQEDVEVLFKILKRKVGLDLHAKLIQLGTLSVAAITFLVIGLFVLTYFYVLPPTAEKAAILIPTSFDKVVGNYTEELFLKYEKIDSTGSELVTKFASKLDFRNQEPLKFSVVKSYTPNALALPNGHIVIFSELLNYLNGPEELAALLSHEVAHINQRHSIKMMSRDLAGYLLISILLTDVNGFMSLILENAHMFKNLEYSRKFEEEADGVGLKLLMDNEIDPEGMFCLFTELDQIDLDFIPEILSTHPLTKNRMENMRKIISEKNYRIKENKELDELFEGIKKVENK